MIRILNKIDNLSLLNAYYALEQNINWTNFGHSGKQSGLQFKDNEDHWTSAVGPSSGNELLSCNLNPFFKGTVFEDIINEYKLYKTRLMWVGSKTCYSMHRDETPRIHIPIITHPDCYFVFRTGMLQHLSTDNVWWVDTTKTHTFINCSDKNRLHLVGAVKN